MGKSLHPVHHNQSLINRGSLTFWVDTDAMNNWFHKEHHGRPGRSPRFTDQTICTFLIFQSFPAGDKGLLDSLFSLMNVPLCAPDYTCVSKCACSLKVAYWKPPKVKITDQVINYTSLKVFGEDEWELRKHGKDQHRV
jgi:hypothetical protein